MIRLLSMVLVAAVLLLPFPAPAAAQSEAPSDGERGNNGSKERLPGKGEPSKELPFIEIDPEAGHADIEAEVVLRKGMLELIATTEGGKEHEAVFGVKAQPRDIHFALLLLGLEPGRPGRFEYANEKGDKLVKVPPRGDRVRITVRYEDGDGKQVERPAGAFARHKETGDPLGARRYIFAGSRIIQPEDAPRMDQPYYAADASGNVITLVTFPDELLTLPEAASEANERVDWEAHTARIPETGTPVTLRLTPADRKDPQGTRKSGDASGSAPSTKREDASH